MPVAVGELFSSPTAKSFADAIRAANGGKGVVVLYGNYAGDNMNVKMAQRMVGKEGIEVLTVVANDDVVSAPLAEREKRRGVAGEILMWKVGGRQGRHGRLGRGGARLGAEGHRQLPLGRRGGWGPAPFRLWGIRTSRSSPARWRSGSAITASPGPAWRRWAAPTRWRTR
jgi:hypothetical protein